MAFVNYNNKEITVKIVYYGPALSGKTTCLQFIYSSKEYKKKGKLITLDTDGDRTLFFDFLPLEIGKLGDYAIKMQLYTVPGQVAYDTTRKLVLQGSDGVVFVADSQAVMREQNISSFQNLKENLKANNIPYMETPLILQYNKRDLKEILPIETLNNDLNRENKPFFSTIGTTGENILEGLSSIMKMVMIHLKNKLTVFQKDKTVMFSREEITDSISSRGKMDTVKKFRDDLEPDLEKSDQINGDTEKEELFELDDPIEDQSLMTNNFPPPHSQPESSGVGEADEDIFNLEDDNIVAVEQDEFEVPDVVLQDELADIKDENVPPPPAPEPDFQEESIPLTVEMVDEPEPVIYAQPVGESRNLSPPETNAQQKTIPMTATVEASGATGNVDIPLTLHLPNDRDEIKINLNLRIIIKKQ